LRRGEEVSRNPDASGTKGQGGPAGEGNWCVETRTKARRDSNSIILRLKTSGLALAVDGGLPRLRLCLPSTAEPLPRIRLYLPSTAEPLPRIRLCHPSTADPLPRLRLCHSSTADPLPRLRLCHPSTADPLPRLRLCHSSTADPLPRLRLCHPSTADPLPRLRLCHPSMADPNLPLGAIFVCLGACLHAPICFWELSSSAASLPPQHLFPFGNDPRRTRGEGNWCVETRTKARRGSNASILRLETSRLALAVDGRLP
jgi:hypothetical protein